jgi:hypothetical protein
MTRFDNINLHFESENGHFNSEFFIFKLNFFISRKNYYLKSYYFQNLKISISIQEIIIESKILKFLL